MALTTSPVDGFAGDVCDETSFTQLLLDIAPIHHLIFTAEGQFVRADSNEFTLSHGKKIFDAKFWGSVVIANGVYS